ncbi:MAG TPA: hypothetical protein PKJ51_08065, partial [Methanothrix sp.]|nr:hypothetical protein [Methanothrix sp.]
MVYLYVLATGTLPSPWSRVTSYDGRYLRCASSGFGTTGGAESHRHPTVACNSGTASGGDSYGEYSGSMAAHSHPVPVTYTGYSNNDPSFYTLSLWRMDATTWESSYRYFPAGVVVASTTTVSATGFSRFTSADDRLIKLADPGSSGGRSTHADHTLSGSLTAVAPGRSAGYPYYHYCGLLKSHSHTYSVSTLTQNTILPARVTTRLYVTTAQTDHAPANIV